jgi:hypothetical protein
MDRPDKKNIGFGVMLLSLALLAVNPALGYFPATHASPATSLTGQVYTPFQGGMDLSIAYLDVYRALHISDAVPQPGTLPLPLCRYQLQVRINRLVSVRFQVQGDVSGNTDKRESGFLQRHVPDDRDDDGSVGRFHA